MAGTKVVPCLLRDVGGSVVVSLHRGPRSGFQRPNWVCSIRSCPFKEDESRRDSRVTLGKERSTRLYGVISCKGVGTER